ncbi:MAG: hypothetical protein GQ532_07210 [Methylomarinum sp.]|nr:hypothetical protein [Methylomarinum sp.]
MSKTNNQNNCLQDDGREYPPVSWRRAETKLSISFVTVHYCDEIYHNLYCSKPVYDESNELIVVDNRNNLFFSCLGKALNEGIEKAQHDLIAVVHEDVLLQPEWQATLESSLRALEHYDPNWALVGSVGWQADGTIQGHWSDPHTYSRSYADLPFSKVTRLDEQLLLFRKSSGLRFDNDLPNIHTVGQDLVMNLEKRGLSAYAIDAPTIHKYSDVQGDLVLNASNSTKIVRRQARAAKLMRECSNDYFFIKWHTRPKPDLPILVPMEDLPFEKSRSNPIVFLGRGGSGSRLISEIAQALGIFMGNSINKSGDTVDIVEHIYKAVFCKYACTDAVQQGFASKLVVMAAAQSVGRRDTVGFKLPELTVLVPELLESLPEARFVFLVRDPLACTLRRLHPTSNVHHELGQTLLPHAYRWIRRDLKLAPVDHYLIRAAASTAFQMESAALALKDLEPGRLITIRFEDIIANPPAVSRRLADWLGVQVLPDSHDAVKADKQRASTLEDCPAEVLHEVKAILKRTREMFGYT